MKITNRLFPKLLAAAMVFMGLTLANEALAKNNYVGQPQQMSVGAFFGGHIGASATYILSYTNAIDVAAAMEMGGDENTSGWADYLWIRPDAFTLMNMNFGYFYGGGAKIRTENDPYVEELYLAGPRAVAGVTNLLDTMPIELYAEAAINYYLTQRSGTEFDIGIGARYYF